MKTLILFAIIFSLSFVACDDDDDSNNTNNVNNTNNINNVNNVNNVNNTNNMNMHGMLTVMDQTLEDLTTILMVDQVYSMGEGWVAVFADDMGSRGALLGYSMVPDATSTMVYVELMMPLMDGTIVHVLLLSDQGEMGTFEYPGTDMPQLDDMSMEIMGESTVTVTAGTPDIRVQVVNIGMSAYTWSMVEPALFSDTLGMEEDNQTLTLKPGWRYEVVNSAFGPHPLEFIMEGMTPPSDDTIGLSQEDPSALEDDMDINWLETEGEGSVFFTVSQTFVDEIDTYRCGIHTATMRGAITYME
jgi:hypothetical protein